MAKLPDIIYYILFTLATYLSFKATKKNLRGLNYLRILLVTGLLNELIIDFLRHSGMPFNYMYHIYIPIEFVLLSLFFKISTNSTLLQKSILLLIPVYFLAAISFSFFLFSLHEYPGALYNLESTLLIVWAVLTLFNLEVQENLRLTQIPLFWISAGVIILYSGIFFYNAVYNYLLQEKSELAKSLRLIINMNFNYLFYIFWSYAFACSIRLKTYLFR